MGLEDNLPLLEYMLIQLARNPHITLRNVKAHGDFKKNKTWTRSQWGNYYADLIAKNDDSYFSNSHLEWSLLPVEQLVLTHSKWHWVNESGHLLLESLPKTLQKHIHLQYMRDRDDYRAKREQPIKWQYAKVGLINDLWKPEKSSLKKKAYGHRLIYDKGWHGGNRAKANAPEGQTVEEWTACGLCQKPDSQHHWIRECQHPATLLVRTTAEAKVLDILSELRNPTIKYVKKDPDLLKMSETLHDFASTAVHGEHLWLGVIYTNMIHHIRQLGCDFPLPDSKPNPRSNKWELTVIKVITPLMEAAKEMWAIKETSRRETILGCLTDFHKRNLSLQKKHDGDIRKWFKRLDHRVGSLRQDIESSHDIDTSPTIELLHELPPVRKPRNRLKPTTPLPSPPDPPIRTRWRNTLMQDHFPLLRRNSQEMLAKHPLPNGHTPSFRHIETGTLDSSID